MIIDRIFFIIPFLFIRDIVYVGTHVQDFIAIQTIQAFPDYFNVLIYLNVLEGQSQCEHEIVYYV